MKLVQDLPEIFEQFEEQRQKAFLEIKEYKDRGKAVVGMYCAYFPPELAIAAGAIPVALCSFSNETIPSAEKYMPKSMCPLVKSSYGFAVEDKCPLFHFADLVIGETTCDGKKKMYEMMAESKPVFIMELPNSQSERAHRFWKEEIIRTKEFLEEFFHVVITEQKLRDAVRLNNRIRMSLKRLCEVMKLDPAPIPGENIQKIVLGCKYRFDYETSPDVIDDVRDKILEEYRNGNRLEKRPRILITGCPVNGDSMKVIRTIENQGGVVVATENCSGVRALSTMVEEDTEDIYGAIAQKYLSTGCSIMTPNDNRIDLLGEIIDEYHVDGVVEVVLQGCHATGAESFYIRKFVNEEKHLPYICITTDYSQGDTGQMNTRLAAFIEMIENDSQEKELLDINYCYKIMLTGLTGNRCMHEIMREISEYSGVAFCIYDENGMEQFAFGKEKSVCTKENEIVRYPDGDGVKLAGYVTAGKKKTIVEKLLDILVKGYQMQEHSREKQKKEIPDFMWIIGEKSIDLKRIYEYLETNKNSQGKLHYPEQKSVFLSGIHGQKDRNQIIKYLKEIENLEGKILIGNGFADETQKEENYKLQKDIMEFVQKKKTRMRIHLTEQYYHELAVSYIGREMAKGSLYAEALEKVKKEDEEKGRDLYETLYWYLRMKRNVSQTAAKLKIHRNTLLPRIARLNEIIDIDEKDGIECERLFLVMEVEQYTTCRHNHSVI